MESKKLRILAIGAHPDDCEYHFGGTAALYLRLGHTVRFVSVTNGNAGHQTMGREELAAVRLGETRRVSELFGVEYEVLGHDDGSLTDGIATRDELIALIRRFRPDAVFTHRSNDYHTDHRHTALLVQDASFLLGVPLVCPQTPCLRYTPAILSFFDTFNKPVEFHADVAVDIDRAEEDKVKMLDCHRSQFYDWLPWVGQEDCPADKGEQLRCLSMRTAERDGVCAGRCRATLAARYGAARGQAVRCAEAFEASEYGAPLTEDTVRLLFPF